MNGSADFDETQAVLDEIPDEILAGSDPIGVTFASGIHESDLFSFLERAKYLAGEMG
jgi:hypothetical protein